MLSKKLTFCLVVLLALGFAAIPALAHDGHNGAAGHTHPIATFEPGNGETFKPEKTSSPRPDYVVFRGDTTLTFSDVVERFHRPILRTNL